MNWSKSQKWDALKATIICQKKGYWVFLVNQNQQKASIMLKQKRLEKILINQDINFLTQIKEIRKNLYEIESKNNISTQKIKKIKKCPSVLKKYHDHDDAKYTGTRDVGNLFNQSTNKDY